MGTYVTEGIVLKHSLWREADRTIVVYTRDRGKVSVVARGARKILSKLAGSVEPVTLVQVAAVHGRKNDTLTGSEVLYSFPLLHQNVSGMSMAMLIGEVIDRSTYASDHDPKIFELLDESLRELELASTRPYPDAFVVSLKFVWQFLAAVGYHPELYNCIECHALVRQEKNFFDFKKGGLICPKCGISSSERLAVNPEMIKVVRWMVDPSHVQGRLRVTPDLAVLIGKLTNTYLNYTHEHGLDFEPFLRLA